MAVRRKSQIEGKGGNVLAMVQFDQSAGQAQTVKIPIKGRTFLTGKFLREVNRSNPYLTCDIMK